MRAIPIKKRTDGKVILTRYVKKILYPFLVERDREKCNICGYIRKETENKLSIDHIENHKPTEHEKAGYINPDDYQLLCNPCNTKKQRDHEQEQKEHSSNTRRVQPRFVGNTTLKPNSNGIEEERENSTEKSIRISKTRKDKWLDGAISILRKENRLKRKDLINYTISLVDRDGTSIRYKSANGYLEEATAPKEYYGIFKEDEEGYISLHED